MPQPIVTNKYLVSGTFTYQSFCDGYNCEDGDRECEGHEHINSIKNLETLATSEEDAIKESAETLHTSMDYRFAQWMIGYPEVKFVSKVMLGARPDIASYWQRSAKTQDEIKAQLK